MAAKEKEINIDPESIPFYWDTYYPYLDPHMVRDNSDNKKPAEPPPKNVIEKPFENPSPA